MKYKRLLIAGLIVFALGAGLTALLRSETVFVWLFHQAVKLAPGEVTVEAVGGRLAGPMYLRGLRYLQEETLIYIGALDLDWRPGRLLGGWLDISQLDVDRLDIHLPPSDGTAATPPPALIVPPVQFSLAQTRLRQVRILRDEAEVLQIRQIDIEARTEQDRLDIVSLQLELAPGRLQLVGHVGLEAPHPLDLTTDWHWQAPGIAALSGHGRLSGDLQQTRLTQTLLTPSAASLSAVIKQPLERLNWQAQLDIDTVQLSQWISTATELQVGGKLQAQGGVEQFSLQGRFKAAGPLLGEVQSEVKGRYSAQVLQIEKLLLQRKRSNTMLSLRGDIGLQQGPNMDLQGDWQNLSWPLVGPPQLSSPTGSYSFQGTLDEYRLKMDTSLQGPALPPGHWQLGGSGQRNGLTLDSIKGEVLDGQVSGEMKLHWTPQLSWQLTLSSQQLDPATFWPVQPGRLAFSMQSQGQIKDGLYQAEARLDKLRGTLQGQPVTGAVQVAITGNRYQISKFELAIGESHVQLSGHLADEWALHWQARSDNLLIFSPLARGRLDTRGRITGLRSMPRIQGTVSADGLGAGTFAAREVRAELDVDMTGQRASRLSGLASQVRYGEQLLETIEIKASSLAQKLSFNIRAQGQALKLDLQASGPFEAGRWQGVLSQADFETPRLARWHLAAPAAFVVARHGLRLDDACWVGGEARLCLGAEQTARDNWRLRLGGKQFPLALAEQFVPENLQFTGVVDGDAALEIKAQQLTGKADWAFSPGSIVYTPTQDKPVSLNYRGGVVRLRQDSKALDGELKLDIDETNHVRLGMALPRLDLTTWTITPTQAIAVDLQARLNQLALLGLVFPEMMETTGEFSADFKIAGSYTKPRIQGYAKVQHVHTALPDLGITLKDLTVTAKANNSSRVDLSGRVRSGEGELQLSGRWQLDPDAGWPLQLSLQGERFEIIRTTEVVALVSPRLKLRMAERRIDVEGDLTIPQAKLEPVALPEGVTVSRDAIITGAGMGEDASHYKKWEIYSRVRISLGDDVHFNGFGLRGRLSGEVLAVDTPQTLTTGTGELVIHNGRYRVHGENLEVDPGRLVFAGGPIDDPGVDARALRRLDEVVAGVQVRGTLKSPQLILFSEPAMRESDILAYIVLGRPLDQTTRSEAGLLIGVSSLLNFTGSRGLNDQIATRFGLEEISLKPGATTEEGVSLVLGKYLSPRLYVSYMIGLMDSVTTVRARYKLGKRVSLQGESSSTQSGADILYTIER